MIQDILGYAWFFVNLIIAMAIPHKLDQYIKLIK